MPITIKSESEIKKMRIAGEITGKNEYSDSGGFGKSVWKG